MKQQTKDYNELSPPTNAAYPWRAEGWQLLCYYCAQPIYETTPEAGYRQRTVYMNGRWLHKDSDDLHCDPAKLRPDLDIDDPRCHCGVQEEPHSPFCSAVGTPPYCATPMSQKEDELIKLFGWSPSDNPPVESAAHTPADTPQSEGE